MPKNARKKALSARDKLEREYLRYFVVNLPPRPMIIKSPQVIIRTFTTYSAYETPIKAD
jgi:hypothetical protein